jgi:hypothetical protein
LESQSFEAGKWKVWGNVAPRAYYVTS